MRFLDTNILIYAVSKDPADTHKRDKALELLESRDLALSTQVLQEFYVQATRATRPGVLTHNQAVSFAMSLRRYPIQEVNLSVVEEAFALKSRFGLSYWDSAILAAARACGCSSVLSEDFSDSQSYAGVRVINPFRE